jgi:hypothetical protein
VLTQTFIGQTGRLAALAYLMLWSRPMTFVKTARMRAAPAGRSAHSRSARLLSSALRLLPALAALAVLTLASVDAAAQTPAVTNIVGAVLRVTPGGQDANSFTTGFPHPGGVPANVINFQDCEADLRFDFDLALSGNFQSLDLVAWAGPTDCTPIAARTSGTATCWPLTPAPIQQTEGPPTDAGAPTTRFEITMRDLASHAAAQSISTTYAPAGESVCSKQSSDLAQAITIYFFYTDRIGGGDAIGFAQPYPIVVDMAAQNVGTSFSVDEQLDSQLTVTIGAAADTDTVAWNIYCDPQPGHETAVNLVPFDAGATRECPASPVDAATSIDASGAPDAGDASATAEAGPALDAGAEDASPDDGSVAEDAEGIADAAPSDSAVVDSALPDSGGGGAASNLDDAGGSACGAYQNDADLPYFGSCTVSSVLQPGVGLSEEETSPDGSVLTDDAGAILYVDGGASGSRQTLGIPSKNLCGTISATSGSFTLTGLKDGYFYNVGVAAVDGAGNVGPLGVSCKEPVELADFWYKYTQAGGQAGGGYCSASEGVGVPAGTGGVGILVAASFIAIARKRRRR